MVKRCSLGTCNSDTRYPDRVENVRFYPFPKPKTNLERCKSWIKACGRPHHQLNVDKITKDTYVCSKHFKDGIPSKEYPDPMPADGSALCKGRNPRKRKTQQESSQDNKKKEKSFSVESKERKMSSVITEPKQEPRVFSPLELLAAAAEIRKLKEENDLLRQQLSAAILAREEHELIAKSKVSITPHPININSGFFSVDCVQRAKDKGLFKYYTGFTFLVFTTLFQFLVPDVSNSPIVYHEKKKTCSKISLEDQLFLVLCRLRNGFHMQDLAYRFNISFQTASAVFQSWIEYMYLRLGYLSLWPHRNNIIDNMPKKFREDFPTTVALIDCTELRIEKPSSLKTQSQCYSDYKSGSTLKALVATDPRGSFMFTSSLFSGSISDKDICIQGHFFDLLKELIAQGKLQNGDAIMADKGFIIAKELSALGLNLNIPPFASSAHAMSPADVSLTQKIAAHRIHVERAINRIKNFKLVSRRIPVTLLNNINEIWFVCCYLTVFQDTLVR